MVETRRRRLDMVHSFCIKYCCMLHAHNACSLRVFHANVSTTNSIIFIPMQASQPDNRSHEQRSTDNPESSNRYHANYYRQRIREENQRARSSMFRRLYGSIDTIWYQSNISLGPFMLDPWERVLSLAVLVSFILLFLYALWHTRPIVWLIERAPCYVKHRLIPLIAQHLKKLFLLNGK